MRRELLRTIIQKRFTMMNRWTAVAGALDLNFCDGGDPRFRSLVFRAFDALVQQLRRKGPDRDQASVSLLEELQIERNERPEAEAYRRFWETGRETLVSFIENDATVKRRFSESERSAGARAVHAAVERLLQREFPQVLPADAAAAETYCTHCGQKLPRSEAAGEARLVVAPLRRSKQGGEAVQERQIQDDQHCSDE